MAGLGETHFGCIFHWSLSRSIALPDGTSGIQLTPLSGCPGRVLLVF